MPLLKAFAFTVVVLVRNREYLYTGEDDVGVDPSVVYRIVAPLVEHEILTTIELVNMPDEGLSLGIATHVNPRQIGGTV